MSSTASQVAAAAPQTSWAAFRASAASRVHRAQLTSSSTALRCSMSCSERRETAAACCLQRRTSASRFLCASSWRRSSELNWRASFLMACVAARPVSRTCSNSPWHARSSARSSPRRWRNVDKWSARAAAAFSLAQASASSRSAACWSASAAANSSCTCATSPAEGGTVSSSSSGHGANQVGSKVEASSSGATQTGNATPWPCGHAGIPLWKGLPCSVKAAVPPVLPSASPKLMAAPAKTAGLPGEPPSEGLLPAAGEFHHGWVNCSCSWCCC
mmetsp:Transcript_135681/g.377929  ORF Transcript_135681/g.377929 Transcript_135681/m.377929 type:complete len:273 (+) Transcript_135681:511-1329(+)